MYCSVTEAALYLATGGFLSEANTILSALWKCHLPHDPNTWLTDCTFETLWYAANERPAYVPFQPIPLDQLEIKHRRYLGGDRYNYPIPKVDWRQLTGKNAFRQAQIWFATFERDTYTLFLLKKALQSADKLAPNELCSAAAMAAELAALQGDELLAITLAQEWAERYNENYLSYTLPIIGLNRHVAPLLLRGILAETLRLSVDKTQRIVAIVTEAIEFRLKIGPTLVYGYESWNQLLCRLSELAIAYNREAFSEEERQAQWIGRDQASEEVIAATEMRLGVTLPEDYKSFLQASNGLSAFPHCNPSLLAVENIDWYKKLEEEELYDITKNYIDSEVEAGTIEPYTERALLISDTEEQMIWLIPPIGQGQAWQTWFFAAWLPGEHRYLGFRHFIEACVLTLEADHHDPL